MLKRDLAKVETQIQQENLKHGNFLQTDKAQNKYEKLDELEKIREAEDWIKEQEYRARNPEAKKNNIFMKLTREDSTTLTQAELQKHQMHKELELRRLRSQQSFEDTKNESFYQQTERKKKAYEEMHRSMEFTTFEDLLDNLQQPPEF